MPHGHRSRFGSGVLFGLTATAGGAMCAALVFGGCKKDEEVPVEPVTAFGTEEAAAPEPPPVAQGADGEAPVPPDPATVPASRRSVDGGVPLISDAAVDAAAPADAGAKLDAAASPADAGAPPDAGTPRDGGTDGGRKFIPLPLPILPPRST